MESGTGGNHCSIFQNVVYYMLLNLTVQFSRRLTLYDKGWEDFYPSCVRGGRYET